jgi:hypothetical protein
MAEWLIFSSMLYFVFSPTTSIFIILGRQSILLFFGVIQFIYRFGIALASSGVMEYIQWLVFFECVNVILFALVSIYFLKRKQRLSK